MSGATMHGKRKTKVGRVVSDKMDKTIVVSVERLSRHPLYKRVIRLTTKFKAHDERNEARVGDTVRIEESRPLSKLKRWVLLEVLEKSKEVDVAALRLARAQRNASGGAELSELAAGDNADNAGAKE